MPRVIVQTDDGRQIEAWNQASAPLVASGNAPVQALLGTLRRALQDAEAVEQGRDPERPSEKAMRLAAAGGWQ